MPIILPKQIWTEEGKLLFQKSEEVIDFDYGKKIVNSLKKTVEHYGGVGLAAPQIGIPQRIFVVNIPQIGFRAYLNPEILAVSAETNFDIEGCLSIFYATLFGKVGRESYIKIKYLDINAEEKQEDVIDPFHARVILHENDHLNGLIFLQRMQKKDFPRMFWDEESDIRKNHQ